MLKEARLHGVLPPVVAQHADGVAAHEGIVHRWFSSDGGLHAAPLLRCRRTNFYDAIICVQVTGACQVRQGGEMHWAKALQLEHAPCHTGPTGPVYAHSGEAVFPIGGGGVVLLLHLG